jgi:hypothetical protein
MFDMQKKALAIVVRLGVSLSSSGNMRTAAKALGVSPTDYNLGPLRERLYAWADTLYQKAKAEIVR